MPFIIISSTALGGPCPPQANVASVYPGRPPANLYNPVSLRLPILRQSILMSVGHVLFDLQDLSTYFLGNSFPSIRTTLTAHLSLLDFITLSIFDSMYSYSNSLMFLFRHCPLSHIGPYTLRRIFLSKIFSLLSSIFVVVQISAACVSNGLTSVLYIRIFVFLVSSSDLSGHFSPKYDSVNGHNAVCNFFCDIIVTSHQ